MTDIEDIAKESTCEVISWSRRTDVPAFYMKEAVAALKLKYVDVCSPYGVKSRLSLKPEHVKCISWWSKDYGTWIKKSEKLPKLFGKYKHMFNFTINGYDTLEPGVESSLDERLQQLKTLSERYTPDAIQYRFDPIVVYRDLDDQKVKDNLENFEKIVKFVSECGVKEIHFAFCLSYPKVVKRMKARGKELIVLDDNAKHEILDKLLVITDKYGMSMYACCTSGVIGYKGKVKESHCIDGDKIEKLIGKPLNKNAKDKGQRKECRCVLSRDAGMYNQDCKHSCDYCYANPTKIE
jgi:DNA repair photolyase